MKKIYNNIRKYMLCKRNKNSEHESGHDFFGTKFEHIAKKPCKPVLDLARKFLNDNEFDNNLCEINTLCPDVPKKTDTLYIRFKQMCIDYYDNSGRLPGNVEIETDLAVSERKRRELIKIAREDNFIIGTGKNRKLNKNIA